MENKVKRIGYLPRKRVLEIIDQISKSESISRSKVVGILVEEALGARGIANFGYSNVSQSSIYMSDNFKQENRPLEIRLIRDKKILEIDFDTGEKFRLPAELLRVESPSAEVQGHGPGQKKLVAGRRHVGIMEIKSVGNYAISIKFDDLHDNYKTQLNSNENIDFNLFLDFANVWEVDYNSSLDSNKVRSSTGLAVNWFSAIGPLTFSYAIPLSEADTDITERFRFQIGTSF